MDDAVELLLMMNQRWSCLSKHWLLKPGVVTWPCGSTRVSVGLGFEEGCKDWAMVELVTAYFLWQFHRIGSISPLLAKQIDYNSIQQRNHHTCW